MILDRRTPPTWREQLRVLVWPRRSWERSAKYVLLRLLRVRASPHQLALGCAIGVFAAITPLVGVQMVLAGILAIAFRASFAAAMLGTFFGNPLTWAVLWPLTYTVGCTMLGLPSAIGEIEIRSQLEQFWGAVSQLSPDMIQAAGAVVWPFMKPMLVGTLPVGLLIASGFYVVCKKAAVAHHVRKRAVQGAGFSHPLGYFVATYDPAF